MTIRSLPVPFTSRTTEVRRTAWVDWLGRVLHAIESRRHLAEMDRRMLADIGVSRSEALHEAGRAPWDLIPPRR